MAKITKAIKANKPVKAAKVSKSAAKKPKKGTSFNKLVPNLITIFAICIGLTAIRFAMLGKWEYAVLAILSAGLFDNLDGRLARLLDAQSKFGAELDSLADMVNFGVVPAITIYLWSFESGKKFVWLAVLIYVVCTGLRLARFNSMLDDRSRLPEWAAKKFFVGMPAPAAASLSLIPLIISFEFQDTKILHNEYTLSFWMVLISGFMISSIPTFSFKSARISNKYIVLVMLICAIVVAGLILETWVTLLLIGLVYMALIPVSIRRYMELKKTGGVVPEDLEV